MPLAGCLYTFAQRRTASGAWERTVWEVDDRGRERLLGKGTNAVTVTCAPRETALPYG